MDGSSIWAGDRVNLTSNATRVAAMKLTQYIASGGGGGERRTCEQPSATRVRDTDPGRAQTPEEEGAAGCRWASAAEERAVSKGVRSGADEAVRALEEAILCTE